MADVVESALSALLSAREQLEGYERDATGESYNDTQINAAIEALRARLSQAGAGGVVVSTDMVNAAWNEAKTRRMTGLPTDFRDVLEAALAASPSAGEAESGFVT
jgi:hypothetical protein